MATYPTEYAHPEALVETEWMEKHLNDKGIRIVESNEDILLYDTGHIPGAVHIDWRADLQDPVIRDYISPEKFARLCSRHGITPDTTCIFYGDKANWWACYALWAFRLFGHDKVKILNGGRDKWKAEGRPMTREIPKYTETNYPVPKKRFDTEIRAFFDEALTQSKRGKPLIDVRSPGEYRGEITHMPEYPQEGVLRGGHVPGAKGMPWKTATNDDSTFKPAAELAKIYFDQCESVWTGIQLSIAELANARVTPGLCLPTSWDSITFAITMVRGPNGAIRSAHRSKKARKRSWGARAPRSLAMAPSPSRTLECVHRSHYSALTAFRRGAEMCGRGARAPQSGLRPFCFHQQLMD